MSHIAIGYKKGVRFAVSLMEIANNGKRWLLTKETALAFLDMANAASAANILLVINSAFRDNEKQVRLYDTYVRRLAEWEALPVSDRGPKPPIAARPGFSNHQSGVAIDIHAPPHVFEWLKANAGRFGFVNTVASEPWHWEFAAPAASMSDNEQSHRA